MEMDQLRSCYKSYMRLYPDRPDVLTLGRWYFCLPGARAVPYKHSFGSSLWDPKGYDFEVPVGEVLRVPGWVSGATDARNVGRHFCGSASAWLEGIPYADRPGLELDAEGLPLCCHYPKIEAAELTFAATFTEDLGTRTAELTFEASWDDGKYHAELGLEAEWYEDVDINAAELALEAMDAPGVVEYIGELVLEAGPWTPPVRVVCGTCTHNPYEWTLTVAGITGEPAVLNGTFSITHRSGCEWGSPGYGGDGTVAYWRVAYDGSNWRVQGFYNGAESHTALYRPNVAFWNCMASNTVQLVTVLGSGTYPAEVTVDPVT